jgi:enoyl-CoA hydratase
MRIAIEYKTIQVTRDGGITWLMFNRPEKKNAMNSALHEEMHDALT